MKRIDFFKKYNHPCWALIPHLTKVFLFLELNYSGFGAIKVNWPIIFSISLKLWIAFPSYFFLSLEQCGYFDNTVSGNVTSIYVSSRALNCMIMALYTVWPWQTGLSPRNLRTKLIIASFSFGKRKAFETSAYLKLKLNVLPW